MMDQLKGVYVESLPARGLRAEYIPLDGYTVIYGKNGAGKTQALLAVDDVMRAMIDGFTRATSVKPVQGWVVVEDSDVADRLRASEQGSPDAERWREGCRRDGADALVNRRDETRLVALSTQRERLSVGLAIRLSGLDLPSAPGVLDSEIEDTSRDELSILGDLLRYRSGTVCCVGPRHSVARPGTDDVPAPGLAVGLFGMPRQGSWTDVHHLIACAVEHLQKLALDELLGGLSDFSNGDPLLEALHRREAVTRSESKQFADHLRRVAELSTPWLPDALRERFDVHLAYAAPEHVTAPSGPITIGLLSKHFSETREEVESGRSRTTQTREAILIDSLSSGEARWVLAALRIGAVTALSNDHLARILWLADEPELHLHPDAVVDATRTLSDLMRRSKGVVIATHDPAFMTARNRDPDAAVDSLRDTSHPAQDTARRDGIRVADHILFMFGGSTARTEHLQAVDEPYEAWVDVTERRHHVEELSGGVARALKRRADELGTRTCDVLSLYQSVPLR
jgi:predicted ATPase